MKPPPALPRWPPLSGSGAEGWPRVLCHASDSSVGVSQLPAICFDLSRDHRPLGEKKRWRNTTRMCFPRSIRWLPPMVRWKLKDKQRTKSRIDVFFLVKVNFQILGENLTLLQFYPFLAYTFFCFHRVLPLEKRSFLKVLDHGCACTNLYGCWSNMACKLSGENDKNPAANRCCLAAKVEPSRFCHGNLSWPLVHRIYSFVCMLYTYVLLCYLYIYIYNTYVLCIPYTYMISISDGSVYVSFIVL